MGGPSDRRGPERELVVLVGASAQLSAEAGVHVVAADPAVLTVALDKWETTCRFLATHGLQHPGHARPEARLS